MSTMKPFTVRESVLTLYQSLLQGRQRRLRKARNPFVTLAVDRLEDRTLLSAIHGQKYDDLDANGVHDSGEPGLNNWTIYLFDGNGNLVTTQTTMDMDINGDNSIDPQTERGLYWFLGLPDDTYTVGEELKAGWVQTDPAAVPVGILQPGYDLFMTDPATTYADLDLDGPGPDLPVRLPLRGDPFGPGGIDTIVRRSGSLDLGIGQQGPVPIELVALSLISVQPISIGGLFYDVDVHAGSDFNLQQQMGSMQVHREHEFGGTFAAQLPVSALLTFSQVGNPTNQFVVPFNDNFISTGVWSTEPGAGDPRLVDPQLQATRPSGGFHPGVYHPNDCQGTKVLTEEQAMLAAHGVLPAMINELVAARTKVVTIVGGVAVEGVTFGNAAKGSIHGYKFEDLNVNGIDDDTNNDGLGDEPRLGGVTITLDGVTDSGRTVGPVIVTTDPNGEYWFDMLTPGRYRVTENPPLAMFPTTRALWTVDLLSHQALVAEQGQAMLDPQNTNDPRVEVEIGPTLAFGNAFKGAIHGRKFEDLNADGTHEAGEPYLNGWTIELVNQNGIVVDSATTMDMDINSDNVIDPDTERGWYWFTELDQVNYTVREVLQNGWTVTAPNISTDPLAQTAFELDQQSGFFTNGNLWENWGGEGEKWFQAANEGNQWYYITTAGELVKWNNQGVQNGSPLTGTLVQTFDPSYHADPAKVYNAQAVPKYHEYTVSLANGEILTDIDFGNFRPAASIHGRKYSDLNADGVHENGEPWLNGWTIELVDAAGTVVATTLTMDMDLDNSGDIDPTTESGWYWLTDLGVGSYTVREVLKQGWRQTSNGSGPSADAYALDQALGLYTTGDLWTNWGGQGEKWLQAANDGNHWYYILPDGDVYRWDNSSGASVGSVLNGMLVETLNPDFHADPGLLHDAQPAKDHQVTIATGLERFEDRDFGNSLPAGSIHGRKYNDQNANGVHENGEPWLNGWTIELVDAAGTVVATTLTMDMDLDNSGDIDPTTESGWYWLTDIGVGSYTVREVLQQGWRQTSNGSGPAADAYALDQTLGLYTTGDLWTNWGGVGEKWLQAANDGNQWYYILPDGDVYRWDNSSGAPVGRVLNGMLVETLNPDFHADPGLLHDAQPAKDYQVTIASGIERFEDRDFGNVLESAFGSFASSGFDE